MNIGYGRTEVAEAIERLQGLAARGEQLVARGRELYCWHPEGIARSKLAAAMADRRLGGTARNWTTVTTLLAGMPDGPSPAR